MNWILVWIASMATIFITAYHYNFFSSIDDLIRTYKFVDYLVALCIGAISTFGGFFIVFNIRKMLIKFEIKDNNYFLTALIYIFSIIFSVIIVRKLFFILSET